MDGQTRRQKVQWEQCFVPKNVHFFQDIWWWGGKVTLAKSGWQKAT